MKDLKEVSALALDILKKKGADDAKVSLNLTETRELTYEGGRFSQMVTSFGNAISLYAIKDKRKGSVAINSFDEKDIEEAAEICLSSAEAAEEDDALSVSPFTENKDFESGIFEGDEEKFFKRITEYIDDVNREFPKIVFEQLIATFSAGTRLYANSNGVLYTHKSGAYGVSVSFLARDGENVTSFDGIDLELLDLDKPIIEYNGQRKLFEMTEALLSAKSFDGKFVGKMLLSPDMLCEFVSQAIGDYLGDGSLIDGTSPWKDKLGKQVTDEKLTVKCIPLDDRIINGQRIHSDGFIAENFTYIEKGVLKSFDLSLYGANKTGKKMAPSTSSALEIEAGSTPLDELIAGIDKGIYLRRFSGGEPASNGDFSGVAKNSFLIENGKITGAISETMISGNIIDMLNNITDLSTELQIDGSAVLPHALVDGITISGK